MGITPGNRTAQILQLLILVIVVKDTKQGYHENRLLRDLFDNGNYTNLERPVANEKYPVNVTFGITLQQIIDVDEKNQVINTNVWLDMDEKFQIINTNVWLDMSWKDYSLAWDESKYNNISTIRVPPKKVWRPDILMYNSADEKFDGTYPTNVVLSSDGSCHYVPPGMFKSTCKIDITYFPFDDQKCTMKFGSWTHDGTQINLLLGSGGDEGEGDISSFIPNGEWDLIGVPGKRSVYFYECCPDAPYVDITFTVHIRRKSLFYIQNVIVPCVLVSGLSMLSFALPPASGEKISMGLPAKRNVLFYVCCPNSPYIDISYTVHIRRRTLYYGFNLILPCCLLSGLSLLTFCLPPDAGEKISLGVTMMLSLFVFLLLVAETMPPTSDAVPLIGMYFGCIMIVCSLSVVFTVLVLNYHYRTPETHPMPSWIRVGVCDWLAWILRMQRPNKPINRKSIIKRAKLREIEMKERSSKSLLANVLDMDDDIRRETKSNGNYTCIKIDSDMSYSPQLSTHSMHTCTSGTRTELRAIYKEIKFITDRMKNADKSHEISTDWKYAASVIDRLCIWLFSIFTVVSTCVIIFSAPHLF